MARCRVYRYRAISAYNDGAKQEMKSKKLRLVVGVTATGSVNLLRGQLRYFSEQDFETYLIAPKDEKTISFCEQENCILLPVKIEREISLLKDLISLWVIFKHFYRIKPDVVNVGTPKMGLLGMIAAKTLGVNRRIYTCRGFRYEHEGGIKRKILMFMERLSGLCAQDIICISPSVKELALKDRLFPLKKCRVINKGSSNGINTEKFNRANVAEPDKTKLLNDLNLSGNFVYGFVGRLIDRKGVNELYHAFDTVYKTDNSVRLLIVGPLEFEQLSDKKLVEKLKSHPGIVMPGRTDDVPLYLSVMDVFVLPAWWEGFGNVLVEAASMGIPVISTQGTGTRDAVNDGFNGILVDVKNVDQLTKAMLLIKNDSIKRLEMGNNGILWSKNFNRTTIWEGMKKLYLNI